MSLLDFLIHIGNIFLFINVIIYSLKLYRRTKIFKILWFYLLSMLIIQCLTIILQTQRIDNLYLSHYYFIVQFILLSLFYIKLFREKKQKNIIKITSIFVLLILSLQYINTPLLYYEFNLLEIVLTSLSLVFFSVIHFRNSLTDKTNYIYINSGIFIYLISSTLIFCSGNFFKEGPSNLKNILWHLNSILFIVYQIFIFVEWYKNFRKIKY